MKRRGFLKLLGVASVAPLLTVAPSAAVTTASALSNDIMFERCAAYRVYLSEANKHLDDGSVMVHMKLTREAVEKMYPWKVWQS